MNSKQMKKWLEQKGATFLTGKGSHLKVFLNGKNLLCQCMELQNWEKVLRLQLSGN